MWFHLSASEVDLSQPITELRPPNRPYTDVAKGEPVLCIAPTVWQCLVSLCIERFREAESDDHCLFIFSIGVDAPEEVGCRVTDKIWTGERRITQAVLDSAGGTIPTEKIGQLAITTDEAYSMIYAATSLFGLSKDYAVIPDATAEKQLFWAIHDGVWTLKLAPSEVKHAWSNFTP